MEVTQNDWGQREITNKIVILTKRSADTIHDFILTKYQKYPSTTILKHANVLEKVNKPPYGSLSNITPHNAYSITIYVYIVMLADSSHEQKE